MLLFCKPANDDPILSVSKVAAALELSMISLDHSLLTFVSHSHLRLKNKFCFSTKHKNKHIQNSILLSLSVSSSSAWSIGNGHRSITASARAVPWLCIFDRFGVTQHELGIRSFIPKFYPVSSPAPRFSSVMRNSVRCSAPPLALWNKKQMQSHFLIALRWNYNKHSLPDSIATSATYRTSRHRLPRNISILFFKKPSLVRRVRVSTVQIYFATDRRAQSAWDRREIDVVCAARVRLSAIVCESQQCCLMRFVRLVR